MGLQLFYFYAVLTSTQQTGLFRWKLTLVLSALGLCTTTGSWKLHISCVKTCFDSCCFWCRFSETENLNFYTDHKTELGKRIFSLSDFSAISEEADSCLKIYFFFVSHIKTVEAHQTFAFWHCLWKLQKCCYKICASFASDTQSQTQL